MAVATTEYPSRAYTDFEISNTQLVAGDFTVALSQVEDFTARVEQVTIHLRSAIWSGIGTINGGGQTTADRL